MKLCGLCGERLGSSYFDSGNSCICEECADAVLVFNNIFEAYVYEEDDKDIYYDDEMSDIEVFDYTSR